MKRNNPTFRAVLNALSAYAGRKDLERTPELYVDTLRDLLENSYNYDVGNGLFVRYVGEILRDPSSGYTPNGADLGAGLPPVFYKEGYLPKGSGSPTPAGC